MAARVLPLARHVSNKLCQQFDSKWQGYVRFLDRYGWKAQAINTCLLVGIGDVAAQLLIKKRYNRESYDFLCSARYFGVGLFVLGPSMHVWYSALDRYIVSSTLRSAVTKMLCDQCLFLPVYVVAIIVVMGILRTESATEIRNQIRDDYGQIMITSYQIWPLLQILNFYFVPLKHRILVMNIVGLVYNTYVAWKVEQRPGVRHSAARPVKVPMKNR